MLQAFMSAHGPDRYGGRSGTPVTLVFLTRKLLMPRAPSMQAKASVTRTSCGRWFVVKIAGASCIARRLNYCAKQCPTVTAGG